MDANGLNLKKLRFRVLITKRLPGRGKYEICLSKGAPSEVEDLGLKCLGSGGVKGVFDEFGTFSRGELLFVDVDLEREFKDGKLKQDDVL